MANLMYVLLEKVGYFHPVHPLLVHVTLGTVIAAFLFAVGALVLRRPAFYTTASHIMVLSLFSTLVTFVLGLADWGQFYDGQMFFTIQIKIILGIVLALLQLAVVLVNRKISVDSKVSLILYTLCLANVVALGYYGAELVY